MRRLAVVLALGLLCGCGQPVAEPGGAATEQESRLDRQARQALARWADAVAEHGDGPRFVPVGDGVAVVGDREPEVAENFKIALMTGQLEAAPGALPAGGPGTGEVRWGDGSVVTLPLTSAEAALQLIKDSHRGECGGCTPLRVIGARLVTASTQTSRGPATAPAWEYQLAGTSARFTQVAVAESEQISVTPPASDPNDPPAGLRVDSATVATDDRTVTVHFVGGQEGSGPCAADYTARAVESEHAAVIIVEGQRHDRTQPCPAVGYPQTATLTLAAPLAERTLLDVVQGMPIPTTR